MHIFAFLTAGVASWFLPDYSTPAIKVSTPYVCAMNTERPGTQVQVVNSYNGRESHCIVTGSGPCCGRAIDVSPKVRNELGFTGLTKVRVYKALGSTTTCRMYPQPETCKPPSGPQFCILDLPKPSIVICR